MARQKKTPNTETNAGENGPSLRDRIFSLSKIKNAALLNESDVFGVEETIPIEIPILNVAASADLDGGLLSWGLLQIAGPSKNFKTLYGLILCKAFLDKYPDGVILFYDNEGGAGISYFKSVGIDPDRVIHFPFTTIEQVKNDLSYKFTGDIDENGKYKNNGLTRNDKVMIFVDSIGNAASKKEAEDSAQDKGTKDMTRAAVLKSFGRIITPHLMQKQIPMVVINHIYMSQDKYPKPVVSGGSGLYLSAQDIWIVSRYLVKEKIAGATTHTATEFTITIEKSRRVRETSEFTIVVGANGIEKYSGLFDLAIAGGFIKMSGAWCSLPSVPNGKSFYRKDVEHDPDFWKEFLDNEEFKKFIRNKYRLTTDEMLLIDKRNEAEINETEIQEE